MGSTKSHTELHEELDIEKCSPCDLDIEKCSPSHHVTSGVTKVPLKITDYQDSSETEEHVTTGTYRSNQVEVVKKQVAVMMAEDSSAEDGKKCSKNNSNSKSGSFQGVMSDDDIIVSPELMNVPRLSQHSSKPQCHSDDDMDTIVEEIFHIDSAPPRCRKLARRLRDRWQRMSQRPQQQVTDSETLKSRDHIPQRRLRDTWVVESPDGKSSHAVCGPETRSCSSDCSRDTDRSSQVQDSILFDVDTRSKQTEGKGQVCRTLSGDLSRKRSFPVKRNTTLKRFHTQGQLNAGSREGFQSGRRSSDANQSFPKSSARESRCSGRFSAVISVRNNYASYLRKNNSDLQAGGKQGSVNVSGVGNSYFSGCRFAQNRRRPGKRSTASNRVDSGVYHFPESSRPSVRVCQGKGDVTHVLTPAREDRGEEWDKCKGDNNKTSTRALPKESHQDRVCRQNVESCRSRKPANDKFHTGGGFVHHVRCRGRRRVHGRCQDNDVISHHPIQPPSRPTRPMMKLCRNVMKDHNVIGRLEPGNKSNNSSCGLGDGQVVSVSKPHVDEFVEQEDCSLGGRDPEEDQREHGGQVDCEERPARGTDREQSSGVFAEESLHAPIAHRPMMRLFKSSFADNNIIGRDESAVSCYFNQDRTTGSRFKVIEEKSGGGVESREDKRQRGSSEARCEENLVSVAPRPTEPVQQSDVTGQCDSSRGVTLTTPEQPGRGYRSHRITKASGVRRQVITGVADSLNFCPIGVSPHEHK